jgi:hypothetical protein
LGGRGQPPARGRGTGEERCPFVDVHIVYVDTVDQSNAWCVDVYGGTGITPDACLYYPIQQLRNIAMSYVRTKYVLSIDVDFIPSSYGLFARALGEMRKFEREQGGVDQKRVWVVNLRDASCDASGTFDGCTPGGMLMPDHPSHAPSYKTPVPWHDSKGPQRVEYEFAYEPYFIGRAEDLPLYDERFWYGNDKVQQVYDTAAAGFNFFVLPPSVGSLVHWEHALTLARPPPLAVTRVPMGLLASVIRRAECVWPGTRDRFVCDSNAVRRSTWWYKLTTPAFFKIAGCENTEQRLFRMSSHTLAEDHVADEAASAARAFADALGSKNNK